MLLLLVVGPPMEEKYGSIPLLKGILFTALVTGVLQCILFPHTGLLGASGIVFMLIMLSSLAGFSGGIPVTMLLVAALYFGQQVYDIIFVHDNVANLCTSWAVCAVPPSAITAPSIAALRAAVDKREELWIKTGYRNVCRRSGIPFLREREIMSAANWNLSGQSPPSCYARPFCRLKAPLGLSLFRFAPQTRIFKLVFANNL